MTSSFNDNSKKVSLTARGKGDRPGMIPATCKDKSDRALTKPQCPVSNDCINIKFYLRALIQYLLNIPLKIPECQTRNQIIPAFRYPAALSNSFLFSSNSSLPVF